MEKIHQDFTGCKFGTATVCDEQIIFTGKSPKTPTEGSKKSPSQRKTISAMSKWLKGLQDTSYSTQTMILILRVPTMNFFLNTLNFCH